MSIATIKAVIDGQTYPLTLSEDGYYVLAGTAPALSSANELGSYYGVQIIATDEAGNETTINQEDGTWGEQLRLVAYESVKPTATITYPSSDSRINTCTPTITAQLRDNDSGVDPATLDLRINGGSKITQGAPGLTLTPVEGGYDLSYAVPTALDEGQTTISVGVSDMDGNAAAMAIFDAIAALEWAEGHSNNPIPYRHLMSVTEGLYYSYNGHIYRCLQSASSSMMIPGTAPRYWEAVT